MNNIKNTLLTATIISLLTAGQTAIAANEAPRDEYSIGVVWSTEAQDVRELLPTNRVNYSVFPDNHVAANEAPRDEYSIGVVWSTDAQETRNLSMSRINYSIFADSQVNATDLEELFPEFEH